MMRTASDKFLAANPMMRKVYTDVEATLAVDLGKSLPRCWRELVAV